MAGASVRKAAADLAVAALPAPPAPLAPPAPPDAEAASGSPSAVSASSDGVLFEPTVEMMVDDFDDERTLDEEEAMAAGEAQDPRAELSSLRREGDMPLEELLELYGYMERDRATAVAPTSPSEPVDSSTVSAPPLVDPTTTIATTVTSTSTSTVTVTSETAETVIAVAPPPPAPPAPSALRRLYAEPEPRLLRSVSRPPSEEEDDCDYSPEEDDWKKTIMVGQDYQAWIPDGLCSYDDALPYENEDKLLWNPAALPEARIEEYMGRVRALASPGSGVAAIPTGKQLRDDEQALFLLQQCGHDVEEALRRRRLPTAPADLWSEEECRNFENGLKVHGKDFRQIHQHKVRTRSIGELVQFYYIWKKTERHDIFANKARLEKKKYTLHPGHTDYMDRFLEEQDGGGGRESPNARGPPEAPPDPLAVGGREVFSELRRPSPALSRSPDTDQEPSAVV